MSNVTPILTGKINLKRFTSFLLDRKAIGSSLSVDRQPAQAVRLEVELVGNTIGTGLVGFDGAIDETFNFTSNQAKVGSINFSSIAGITTSGITDGFIQVRGFNSMGQPVNQEITVSSNVAVRFFEEKGRIRVKRSGQQEVADYKLMGEPMLDIRENDLIQVLSGVVGLTLGKVVWVEKIFDFAGATHHVEAEVMRL